jgi:anti-sigma-K factor RskA
MNVDDCKQLGESYEAYALGALEGEEREEIERHLARGCAACTAGVAQARWVVAQLAALAPEAEPPTELRARILAAVNVDRISSTSEAGSATDAELRGASVTSLSTPTGADARAGAGSATGAELRGATSIASGRATRRPPSAVPAWAWAIAAALLLATGYSAWQTRRLDRQLESAARELRQGQARQAAIESEREHYEMAMQILSAQDTKALQLTSKKAAMPPVQAYWSPKMGLLVMSAGMPQMPSSMTLQLWMVPKKGAPMSVGIFRPDAAGHVMLVAATQAPITEIAALAISEEPAGGSAQPTSAPVWVGPLT